MQPNSSGVSFPSEKMQRRCLEYHVVKLGLRSSVSVRKKQHEDNLMRTFHVPLQTASSCQSHTASLSQNSWISFALMWVCISLHWENLNKSLLLDGFFECESQYSVLFSYTYKWLHRYTSIPTFQLEWQRALW